MNEYLKAQNKTNEIIITNNFTSNELNLFSASDFRWADNRTKQFRHKQVKKGEIYQFEFGKNYKPEMSYEHRGLVIGVKQKLLYVLLFFSYDPAKHPDVYHPTDNPASKSDMFLLKFVIKPICILFGCDLYFSIEIISSCFAISRWCLIISYCSLYFP